MSAQLNEREFTFGERDFRRVCALIRERVGIALTDSKRDMVYSRLVRRVRARGVDSFNAYLDTLQRENNAEEWQEFTNALTTNLTSFFREPHHFDHLIEHLGTQRGTGTVAIWCCAASTGEEPYSIAMAACEAFGTSTPPVTILATDVDTNVLDTASAGIYSIDRIAQLSDARRRKFFQRGAGAKAGLCRVQPSLRALVEFRPLNLLDADYGLRTPFVAIFCRNVMIYFEKPTQYEILTRLAPLLRPDGFLYAGHSESFFHAADLVQSCGRTIYSAAPRTPTRR